VRTFADLTEEDFQRIVAEGAALSRALDAQHPRTGGVAMAAEHVDVVVLRVAVAAQRARIERLERAVLELAAATGNTDVVLLLREVP